MTNHTNAHLNNPYLISHTITVPLFDGTGRNETDTIYLAGADNLAPFMYSGSYNEGDFKVIPHEICSIWLRSHYSTNNYHEPLLQDFKQRSSVYKKSHRLPTHPYREEGARLLPFPISSDETIQQFYQSLQQNNDCYVSLEVELTNPWFDEFLPSANKTRKEILVDGAKIHYGKRNASHGADFKAVLSDLALPLKIEGTFGGLAWGYNPRMARIAGDTYDGKLDDSSYVYYFSKKYITAEKVIIIKDIHHSDSFKFVFNYTAPEIKLATALFFEAEFSKNNDCGLALLAISTEEPSLAPRTIAPHIPSGDASRLFRVDPKVFELPALEILDKIGEERFKYILEHHFGVAAEFSGVEYCKQRAAAINDTAETGVLATVIDRLNHRQEKDALPFIAYSKSQSSVLPFFYNELDGQMAMTGCLKIVNESPLFSNVEKQALKHLIDEKKLQIFAISASEKANISVNGKLFSRSSELFCIDLYFIGDTSGKSRVGHAVTLAEELCHLLFQSAYANNTNPYDKKEASRRTFEERFREDLATIEKKSQHGLLSDFEEKIKKYIDAIREELPQGIQNAEISAKLCAFLADSKSNVAGIFPETITYCRQQMVLGATNIIDGYSIQPLSNQAHCENKPPLPVFSTTRTYSASEQETIIAALKYPVTEPSVMKVSHGTGQSQVESIQAGVKNMGGGFGGAGLYLDPSHDSSLAKHYATIAEKYYLDHEGVRQLDRGAVMFGELKLTPETRRAKIVIAHRDRPSDVNIARGIFPASWSESPALQQLVHRHFDVLVVQGAETSGYASISDNFLVALESKNKNMLTWNKAPLTGLPVPVQQFATRSNVLKIDPTSNLDEGVVARRAMPKPGFSGSSQISDGVFICDKPKPFKYYVEWRKSGGKARGHAEPRVTGLTKMGAAALVIVAAECINQHNAYPGTPLLNTALIAGTKIAIEMYIATQVGPVGYAGIVYARTGRAVHNGLENYEIQYTAEHYQQLLEIHDVDYKVVGKLVAKFQSGDTADGIAFIDNNWACLKSLFPKILCQVVAGAADFVSNTSNATARAMLNKGDFRGFENIFEPAQEDAPSTTTPLHSDSREPLENPCTSPNDSEDDDLVARILSSGPQPMSPAKQNDIKSALRIESIEVTKTPGGGISVSLTPVNTKLSLGIDAHYEDGEGKIEFKVESDNPLVTIPVGLGALITNALYRKKQKKIAAIISENQRLTKKMFAQLDHNINEINALDYSKPQRLDSIIKLLNNLEEDRPSLVARFEYAAKKGRNKDAAYYLDSTKEVNKQVFSCKKAINEYDDNKKQQAYFKDYAKMNRSSIIAELDNIHNKKLLSHEQMLRLGVLQRIIIQDPSPLSEAQGEEIKRINNKTIAAIPDTVFTPYQDLPRKFIEFKLFGTKRSTREEQVKRWMEQTDSSIVSLSNSLESKSQSQDFNKKHAECEKKIDQLINKLKKIELTLDGYNNAYEYCAEAIEERTEFLSQLKKANEDSQFEENKHPVFSKAELKSINDKVKAELERTQAEAADRKTKRRYREHHLFAKPWGDFLRHVLHHETKGKGKGSPLMDVSNIFINQGDRVIPGLYTSFATIPIALVYGEGRALTQQFSHGVSNQLSKVQKPLKSVNRGFQAVDWASGLVVEIAEKTSLAEEHPKAMDNLRGVSFVVSKSAGFFQAGKYALKGKGCFMLGQFIAENAFEQGFSIYETMHSDVQLPENYSDYTLSNAYAAAVIRIFGNVPGTQPMHSDYYVAKDLFRISVGLGFTFATGGVLALLGAYGAVVAKQIYDENTGNDKRWEISALKAALANYTYHSKSNNTEELDKIIIAMEQPLRNFRVGKEHNQIDMVNHCRTVTMNYNLKKVLNPLEDKAKILDITSYSHINNCFYFRENNLSVSYRPDFVFTRLRIRLKDKETLKDLFSLENLQSDQNIYQDFWLALYAVLENEDTFTKDRDELQTAYQNVKSFAEIIRDHHFNTLRSRVEPIDGEIEYYSNLSLATAPDCLKKAIENLTAREEQTKSRLDSFLEKIKKPEELDSVRGLSFSRKLKLVNNFIDNQFLSYQKSLLEKEEVLLAIEETLLGKRLEAAQEKFNNKRKRLGSAWKEHAIAEQLVDSVRVGKKAAKVDFDAAHAELDTAQIELDTAQAELDAARENLDAARKEVDVAKAEVKSERGLASSAYSYKSVLEKYPACVKKYRVCDEKSMLLERIEERGERARPLSKESTTTSSSPEVLKARKEFLCAKKDYHNECIVALKKESSLVAAQLLLLLSEVTNICRKHDNRLMVLPYGFDLSGDENNFFAAVASIISISVGARVMSSKALCNLAFEQIETHKEQYSNDLNGLTFEAYSKNFSKENVPVDSAIIKAFSRVFGISLVILSDDKEDRPVVIKQKDPRETLYLYHIKATNCYQILLPCKEAPPSVEKILTDAEFDAFIPSTTPSCPSSETPPSASLSSHGFFSSKTAFIKRPYSQEEKINPSIQECHKSGKEEAALYGYIPHETKNDGSCFYHAIAYLLSTKDLIISPENLRKLACDYISERKDFFGQFMDDDLSIDDYISYQRKQNSWADNTIAVALAHALEFNIITLCAIKNNGEVDVFTDLVKIDNDVNETLFILNINNIHYEGLERTEGLQPQKSLENLVEASDIAMLIPLDEEGVLAADPLSYV